MTIDIRRKIEMIVIKSNTGAFFDIDETIALMDNLDLQTTYHAQMIEVIDLENSIHARIVPHYPIIQKMKEHYSRGHIIFVWSAGGYAWANAVIRTLGLEYMVTAIIPKGPWIWDDKMPNDFLSRHYIKPIV